MNTKPERRPVLGAMTARGRFLVVDEIFLQMCVAEDTMRYEGIIPQPAGRDIPVRMTGSISAIER